MFSVQLSSELLQWNQGAVVKIAASLDEDAEPKKKTLEFSVLADALEEAGCQESSVLRHCREATLHTTNCPVLQAILKTSPTHVLLNWQEAYRLLGIQEQEYREQILDLKICEGRCSYWNIPMLKPRDQKIVIGCNAVLRVLRNLGVDVEIDFEVGELREFGEILVRHDRTPNKQGSYVISVRANQEADQRNIDQSANVLKKKRHRGITLDERLRLELAYFLGTGNHLDCEAETLCTGSRFRLAGTSATIPSVSWSFGEGRIRLILRDPDEYSNSLRSRSVKVLTPL